MKKYKNKPNTIVNIENDNNFVKKSVKNYIHVCRDIIYINIYVYIVVNYSNKT